MDSITLQSLSQLKQRGEKFTCLTAYDATFAQLLSDSGIEVLLVGDSLGMVLQGHSSTLPVTMEHMIYHTESVARGNKNALLMVDMPFMSYANVNQAMNNAALLMQAGAQIVKLEGGQWLIETVTLLNQRGIPSCVHLGLTPQSVHKFSGYRVQGKGASQAKMILQEAIAAQQAGASVLLLECVPHQLTQAIMQHVSIPVIGIGAGNQCDGQVLVLHDLLGISPGKRAKFVKNFMAESKNGIAGAIQAYIKAVKNSSFPSTEYQF